MCQALCGPQGSCFTDGCPEALRRVCGLSVHCTVPFLIKELNVWGVLSGKSETQPGPQQNWGEGQVWRSALESHMSSPKCFTSISPTGCCRGPFTHLKFLGFTFFFVKRFLFIFRGRGGEGEKERNISQLPLACLQLDTWPTTQASALARN